jgi:hypothetical protein
MVTNDKLVSVKRILEALKFKSFAEVRNLIREQVLRTDMTLHYELTKEWVDILLAAIGAMLRDCFHRIIALATKGVPVEGCETTPLDLKDDTQRRVALQASNL